MSVEQLTWSQSAWLMHQRSREQGYTERVLQSHNIDSALTTVNDLCLRRLVSPKIVQVRMVFLALFSCWAKCSWGSKLISIALPMSPFANIIFNNQLKPALNRMIARSLSIYIFLNSFPSRTANPCSYLSQGSPMWGVKLTFCTCIAISDLL